MTLLSKYHLASACALAALLATGASRAETTLTLLLDNGADVLVSAEALIEAYSKLHPDVTIEIDQRPGGSEGDNTIKTRLATGEMADVFLYNAGSLLQVLKPDNTLVDLTGLPALDHISSSFKSVAGADGKVFGVPFGSTMAGGILYNKNLYQELGLKAPRTWAEFMANNEKIKASGKVAVAQTYRDSWTSQLIVLSDYYNVQAEVPNFAAEYTANKIKYATTPAALRSFERLQDIHDRGFMNDDFGAASYDDALTMLAEGQAAHYPILSLALGALKQNYPESLKYIGFFAQPGDDADKNGLTVWMPPALYIPASSQHIEDAKKFLDFVGSAEGCTILMNTGTVQGPSLVEGCSLPADVPVAVTDMLPYFESGKTAPALEYLSPIKGPTLQQITVEVGSGMRKAADAAALYDADVRKQAQQLGLPNW